MKASSASGEWASVRVRGGQRGDDSTSQSRTLINRTKARHPEERSENVILRSEATKDLKPRRSCHLEILRRFAPQDDVLLFISLNIGASADPELTMTCSGLHFSGQPVRQEKSLPRAFPRSRP